MEVDYQSIALFLHFVDDRFCRIEGTVDGGHLKPALKIDHSDFREFEIYDGEAVSGNPCRIIRRTQDPFIFIKCLNELFPLPDMISACDHIDPEREELT